MKRSVSLTAAILLLGVAGVVSAQESSAPPQILQRTLQYLQQYGWSEDQLDRFRQAAGKQNWEEADGADPEIVALALRLGNQEREQLNASENADLALELAHMARTMQSLGFQSREISEAAFEGTRDIVRNMQQMRAQIQENVDLDSGDTALIRERIRQRIREHLEESVQRQARAHERAAQQKRNAAGETGLPAGKPQNVPGGRD